MDSSALTQLLKGVKSGAVSIDDAHARLKDLPFAELGYATVDTHRALRAGFPEVVLGEWKTSEQCVGIVGALVARKQSVLVTRLQREKAEALLEHFPLGVWHATARVFELRAGKKKKPKGKVAIVCAGTSDLPVADEAAVTAEAFGVSVRRITDVGVAGIHRLLKKRQQIAECDAVVAIAGMEGALAAAVGGLVGVPVVAVPTSIGYGANLGGVTTLLSMLSSCAANVAVVNIDNGFGAGFYAALIARKSSR